jgi:hypothetical protein
VRLAGHRGQPLPDRGGIAAVKRRQRGRQAGERAGGRGEADHRPGGRARHLHAPAQRGHQAGLEQRGLAGPRRPGHHDDPRAGQLAGQLRSEPFAAAEHGPVLLAVRKQPAVRASGPARARPRGAGRTRLPLTGVLLDDRELFADQAYVRRLPADLEAGRPEFRVLPAQAVLDLPGRPGQVGQHEGHVAELGAQRLDGGQHLVLELGVAGLDRGPERRAARVDLPQHHRDVGTELAGALAARGERCPDALADLPLQVAAQVRLSTRPLVVGGQLRQAAPVLRLLEQAGQGIGADRGEHPRPGPGARARAALAGPGQSRGESRGAQ